jgi:hypothetical protein
MQFKLISFTDKVSWRLIKALHMQNEDKGEENTQSLCIKHVQKGDYTAKKRSGDGRPAGRRVLVLTVKVAQ